MSNFLRSGTYARRLLLQSSLLTSPRSGTRPIASAVRISDAGSSNRFLHASCSRLGVKSSLRDMYDTAKGGADEKREKRMFELQMELLRDRSRIFDGNRFLDLLAAMKDASGMGGVKEHLPWVAGNPALGEIKDQQAVIHAMSPDERQRLGSMGIAAKKRISRSTGQSLDAIDAVFSQVSTLQGIQKWVVRREDAGETLPMSSAELRAMISAPGSGMSKRAPRSSGAARARPGVKSKR